MVHFGRYIKLHRIPGWETYYIGYKQLKKRINENAIHAAEGSEEVRQEIVKKFSKLLDSQVEKIVLFLIERQGFLARDLRHLREEAEHDSAEENEELSIIQISEKEALIEKYRQIGRELLDLLQYVEMNIMGLRKILKKFDKRLGLRLREQYLLTRINHPYSQVQMVLRQVGIGAIIATISRNLAELQSGKWRGYSSFALSARPPKTVIPKPKDPIIKAIETEYQKLTQEASVLSFIANTFLLQPPEAILSDQAPEDIEYHAWSAHINLLNTFLYMVNYYVIVPTSDDYAQLLDMPATLSGVIIGSMPLTATVSAVLFSWWSNKSYKAPLIVSTLLLIGGNFLYALALPFNSVWLLLAGRALEGLGCARAINRRYIMHEVPPSRIRNFSAAFVSVSALGMTVGPALASTLNYVDFEVFGVQVNYCTAPGWLVGLMWLFYLLFVLIIFKEPKKLTSKEVDSESTEDVIMNPNEEKFGESDSLLESDKEKGIMHKTKASHQNSGSLIGVLKEMTLPIQILLANYFMLKFASEMLISEATLVAGYYFSWSSSLTGWFLGALGLTVLPSSALVANYISNRFDERLILLWTLILTAIGVLGILSYFPLFPYTEAQYIIASFVIFISTNILEGVDMSLLAKMMSPRLSKGLFNCGFLSTEAGTIARAIADGLITLVGKGGMDNLLNFTMLPTLAIVFSTIIFTWIGYFSLY